MFQPLSPAFLCSLSCVPDMYHTPTICVMSFRETEPAMFSCKELAHERLEAVLVIVLWLGRDTMTKAVLTKESVQLKTCL